MTPNYFRASYMAYKTLLAIHIDALPIEPMQILSYCKNVVVHTYDEAAEAFGFSDADYFRWMYLYNRDAVTFRRELPDGRVIYELLYDHRSYGPRQRFTLGHELGHIVLKHRMEETWEDQEADYYASQLLAPRPVFQLMKESGMDTSSPEVISSMFCLSKAASRVSVQPLRHCPDPELSEQIKHQFAEEIRRKGGVLSA